MRMKVEDVLNEVLKEQRPLIHNKRLDAVLDVAEGLRNSQNLSLSSIGRALSGKEKTKHKIKKVDRCLGNKHLYNELSDLYGGLSHFVFQYVQHSEDSLILIDLCYLKSGSLYSSINTPISELLFLYSLVALLP